MSKMPTYKELLKRVRELEDIKSDTRQKLEKSYSEFSALSKRESQVNKVLKNLALGGSLDEVLAMILNVAEEESPGTIASILLVDKDGKKLLTDVKTRLPKYFTTAIDGTPIKDGMGSCGTAAFRGKTVIVENIQTHPYWKGVRELTQKAGLGSCWSQPVIASNGNVVGTFALYSSKPKQPSQDELKLMERMAQLAAISLESHHIKKEKLLLSKMLGNIIDSMPSVLIGVDPAGNVTQWNRKAEQETGITFVKAVGQQLEQVFPRMSSEMKKIYEAMKKQEMYSESRKTIKIDGKTRYEHVTVYPLISNGMKGAVIRVDDVTEQVKMEKMMVQSEKMLSIGGLAAGMAHEINNPLAGMIQNANVLSNRLTNTTIPANKKAAEEAGTTMAAISHYMGTRDLFRMIKAITDSGSRMASIVENMLSFARRSDSTYSTHNFTDLMDKVLELARSDFDLKKHYDFKSIIIEKVYEKNLPLILCVGSEIQQVLLNILKNGAYAMFEASKATKPKFTVRLQHEVTFNMLRIEIKDNGPGIDKETCKRVFEPFFTTKPVGVGTGLGLSVSYFIITENHNGTMTVTSEPKDGTNFIIRLPIERKTD